jgi:hypothetical protein
MKILSLREVRNERRSNLLPSLNVRVSMMFGFQFTQGDSFVILPRYDKIGFKGV